jgi:hypothetical protein
MTLSQPPFRLPRNGAFEILEGRYNSPLADADNPSEVWHQRAHSEIQFSDIRGFVQSTPRLKE